MSTINLNYCLYVSLTVLLKEIIYFNAVIHSLKRLPYSNCILEVLGSEGLPGGEYYSVAGIG